MPKPAPPNPQLMRVALAVGAFALFVAWCNRDRPLPSPASRDAQPSPEEPRRAQPRAEPDRPAQPRSGVTMANYQRLTTGMSYAETVQVLGEPGEEQSRSEMAGLTTVMYTWKGGFMSNMNAMFQNDKLVTRAQFGLH